MPSHESQLRSRQLDRVLSLWRSIAEEHEPWIEMVADDFFGELRPLAAAFLTALPRGTSIDDRRQIAWTAANHGTYRRYQGTDVEVVRWDVTLLRDALRQTFRHCALRRQEATRMSRELESNVMLASHAAARGYLRREIEREGNWPGCIESLVGDDG